MAPGPPQLSGAVILLVFLLSAAPVVDSVKCPAGCYCDERRSGGGGDDLSGDGVRVNCHPLAYGSVDFSSLPENTVHLDLARYGLDEITADMFRATPRLQKLDLQNNDIEHVEEDAFRGLERLRVLDMSRNKLEFVSSDTFDGLKALERLKLNENRIQTLESGAFDDLQKLEKLEISGNPFTCDCNLAWFLRWLEARESMLSNALKTRCELPEPFADEPLKKVNPSALVCENAPSASGGAPRQGVINLRPPGGLELVPSHSQVTFEGDSLTMSCKADGKGRNQKVKWLIRGKEAAASKNVTITTGSDFQDGSEKSILTVKYLRSPHSGEWTCSLEDGGRREFHRSASVLVITKTTQLCRPLKTSTSRGDYTFGTAIGGHTVQQPCERIAEGRPFGFAYLLCRESGEWAATVNTSQCAYTSAVTDTLHKFAAMNMTFTPRTLMESARQFLNFTADPAVFQDEMDLVYFSHAVENYLPYLERIGIDLGHYMLSMISNVLGVSSERLLIGAQTRDRALQRLRFVVSNVTTALTDFLHHSNKMAVEAYDIRPVNFEGVTCSWYESSLSSSSSSGASAFHLFSRNKRIFHCADSTNNKTVPPSKDKVILASVALPKSIYGHMISVQQQREDRARKDGRQRNNRNRNLLVFSAYDNATLFPDAAAGSGAFVQRRPVIGVQLGSADLGFDHGNLADPVNLVLKFDDGVPAEAVQPVWWDPSANDGFGAWRRDSCKTLEVSGNLVWFQCWRLGHYSYRISAGGGSSDEFSRRAAFRPHHPLTYVGAAVCVVLMAASAVVYCISFHSIMISRRLKHALVNIWAASSSLVFLYIAGIYQTEDAATCQAVGISAHYLTLSSLVWLTISVSVIYQKANRARIRQSNGGNVPAPAFLDRQRRHQEPPQSPKQRARPVSRLYLIGYGVGAAVCAICAAVSVDNYGTPTHCFMHLVPFLAGVVVPLAVLSALIVGFSLSAWCLVATSPSHIAEQLEVDALPDGRRSSCSTQSSAGVSLATRPDLEKSVKSLLLAHAYVLVLFLSTWMSGSLAVLQPLRGSLPYEELVFAVLFSISSISLGVFVFVYFCASRQDVQEAWRSPLCISHAGRRRYIRANRSPTPAEHRHHQQQQQQHYQQIRMPNPPSSQFGSLPPPQGPNSAGAGHHPAHGGHYPQHFQGFGPQPPSSPQYHHQGHPQDHQQQNDSFKIYDAPSPAGFRPAGVKVVNLLRKESEGSTGSLNNVNHLRRGYMAPVNSEADYGVYSGPPSSVFGPCSSTAKVNNTNIHVDMLPPPPQQPLPLSSRMQRKHQPQTSSPAAGEASAPLAFTDQDMTASPLAFNKEDQDSTVKVGAPCQMASFATADFPHFSQKPPLDPLKPRRGGRGAGDIAVIHGDAIDRASDLERLETQSKISGVSSVYSSKSGGGGGKKKRRRRQKRPNPRNKPGTGGVIEEDDDALMTCAGISAKKERSKVINGDGIDDNYMADDDFLLDTLERVKEEVDAAAATTKFPAISSSQGDEDTEAITTSQYSSSEMANRETSV